MALSGAAMGQSTTWGIVDAERLEVPQPTREMRAAWVATVWNIDWPTTRNNVTSQRTQMNAILDQMAALNMNAVFLQVRSQADAMYPSTLEPWSYFLTGRMGRDPVPATYDPLQEWITAARARGIQVHAWFNPYRALGQNPGAGDAGFIDPDHVYNADQGSLRSYGGDWWFDPGLPASVTRTTNAILDVVTRYDIDGVVFDDYFYPYPVRDANNALIPFPDSTTYAAYQIAGGQLSLANWRRQNVDNFVFNIRNQIQAVKPHVLFGIGPFGIWQSGVPAGIVGLSSFSEIYADSKKWLNNGWVDYLSPQLYWRISAPQQSYPTLLSWWSSQNTQGRHMWPSNFTSKIVDATSPWPVQEIVDQINVTRNTPGVTGNVHYSVRVLRDNNLNIRTTLQTGQYANDVVIPATTWLTNTGGSASKPNLNVTRSSSNLNFSWSNSGGDVRWWLVQTNVNGTWNQSVLPSSTLTTSLPVKGGVKAFSVRAVDRLGRTGQASTRVFDTSIFAGSSGD